MVQQILIAVKMEAKESIVVQTDKMSKDVHHQREQQPQQEKQLQLVQLQLVQQQQDQWLSQQRHQRLQELQVITIQHQIRNSWVNT